MTTPQPAPELDRWLRRELGRYHDAVLREDLPDELLALLRVEPEPRRHP